MGPIGLRAASRPTGRRSRVLWGLLLCWPWLGSAAEHRLVLDPDRVEVRFTVSSTLHDVHGSARLAASQLGFDPAAGSVEGEIVVDAESLETGNARRDRQMHNKVLASSDHPRIVFRAASFTGDFEPTRPSTLAVAGSFEIRGETHDIVVPVELHPVDGGFRLSASFVVPYVAWGLPNPSRFVLRVGKEVEVDIAGTVTID